MDCNREEAIRAKGIAEKKMQGKDFMGARKMILKAQQLFPDLENVLQMLTVCDVHCSAELNKVFDSERDWYGILQVDQTADEAYIKKQYRKLALLLHPDKNKFAGAEEAFKLIGDGHRVLSDQAKRSFYDMKIKIGPRILAAKQPHPQPNRNPYARKQPAVKTNFVDRTNPQQQQKQNQSVHRTNPQFTNLNPQQQQQQNQSELPKCPTFWTVCPFCGVKSQYYRTIMGRAIPCHKCRGTFIPQDMFPQGAPLGGNSGNTSWIPSGVPQQDGNLGQGAHKVGPQYSAAGNSSSTRFQENVSVRETFSKTGIGGEAKSKAKEDGNADKRAKFEAKKVSEVNTNPRERKKSGNESRKRATKVDVESIESRENTAEDVRKGWNEGTPGSRYPLRSTRHKPNVACNISLNDDDDFVDPPSSKRSRRDGSSGGAVGQSSESLPQGGMREGKQSPVKEELPNGKEQVGTCKTNGREQVGVDRENKTSNFDANPKENLSVDSSVKTKSDVEAFEYPDPEFYDFDKDRNGDKFKVEQIWAIYDDTKEGMPRYYARIRKVFSPFKLRITWLEYAPEDQDEINSSNRKWPIALGTFRLGDTQYTDDPIFSHLVSWEKGTRDRPYKIYPRKGEIWAIYKDWNIKWSFDQESPIQYGYEIVEIFSDYAEGNGFSVAYLAKVERCVFRRQSANNVSVLFQIPSHEIYRFSHKIPSYEITGAESKGVPEGSLELDPACLPKEFLNCGDGRVSSDGINSQGVGLCSNSPPRKGTPAPCSKENPTTPKRSIELNEKNIQEKQNPEKKSDCSPRAVDGTHEKKPRQANASESISLNANKKERHLQAGKISPNVTEHHSPSPTAPLEAVEEDSYSEFHNFNADRSQEIFRRDQLWALYSNMDGMPNCYARIKKIESPDFKIHVRWLEICPVLTKEISWINKELPVSCGTFKLKDASDQYSNTNKFSHRVRAKANFKRNRYEIYPKDGDVWAVYKNWSSGWTSRNLESCKYEIVEILGTTSSSSVKALVLEKVDGFKNVFAVRKIGRAYATIEIPPDKLQSFSHWVPAFRLTEERGGNLKGYWELDPAAIPAV